VRNADLIENTEGYFEISSLLLTIRTATTAVKAMCKCCGRGYGGDSNPYLSFIFNATGKLYFLNLVVIPSLKFEPLYVLTLRQEATAPRTKGG
jgi:hypothetical protein